MNAIAITPVQPADSDDWRRLWTAYLTFYRTVLPEAVFAHTWQRLLDPAHGMFGALARVDGGPPVGLVHWLRQPTCWDVHDGCYLQDLYVHDAQRSDGIGGALIAHVVADAAAFGAAHVHWLTHETNTRARRLYDRVALLSGFVDYRIAIPR